MASGPAYQIGPYRNSSLIRSKPSLSLRGRTSYRSRLPKPGLLCLGYMVSIRVILPCYLSNEFAGIKETNLLLFVTKGPVALHAFREDGLSTTFFRPKGPSDCTRSHWKSGSLPDSAGRLPACRDNLAGCLPNPSAARGTRGDFAGEMQMFENLAAEA